ncbi:hypothetical protein B0J14DRAFT_661731 [Halenospora varia]|nr:hypothetical protein B0J14DRAFT_661731 [Halenospora varia]
MAPTKSGGISKPGGIPRLAWNASRNRKLIRLYLLTNITPGEIQWVLSSDGFKPSERSIQAQISTFLPNCKKDWRQYRPSSLAQAKTRLANLKDRERIKSRNTYVNGQNSRLN